MRRRALLLVLLGLAVLALGVSTAAAAPPVRHVFVIVLENESESATFGPGSPAPYLAQTLRSQGAFIPNYFGTGHQSNDNYIAMISGQAPNAQNQADCQVFNDVTPGTIGPDGQAEGNGCVYPSSVPTIASQLSGAGYTWRDYNQSMGADPTREPTVCAHPAINASDNTQTATASDSYATRHNPFVYFHSIIDDTTLCDTHVVNFDQLAANLSTPGGAANYSFITPDLCNDGHDSPCKNGQPGGLVSANSFLKTWVPRITASPSFRQDGLLIVTFDEASTSDASSCCGEIPGAGGPAPGVTGLGGGKVGAVLLSPCIAPGTVTQAGYNHYSMLASVENVFGLPRLGYAGLSGVNPFGSDIYNRSCGPAAPQARIHAPPLQSSVSSRARVHVSWSATTTGGTALSFYTVRVRALGPRHARWRTLRRQTTAVALNFRAALGHTYSFQVTATNLAGQVSRAVRATTLVPSGIRIARGHYVGAWIPHRVRGAWQGRAMTSHSTGASFGLVYVGGGVEIIGERGRQGGVARVTFDHQSRVVQLQATRRRLRRVIFRVRARSRRHHLTLTVLRGTVSLEGFAVSARRR